MYLKKLHEEMKRSHDYELVPKALLLLNIKAYTFEPLHLLVGLTLVHPSQSNRYRNLAFIAANYSYRKPQNFTPNSKRE